ncbi:hypothetical protein JQ506_12970 [Shinella sp. PSBB067]|uniref:hypothetical protein n=1 Tax=Shinella sp. PSBB067 TaxID=2715959 RepID=UPI00193B8B19|nr:hypothetical protein [Shinella sp. PSBB067]QRI61820.1 hypothetical protein JQ506_12970 [Shinella sp. PSBB067]
METLSEILSGRTAAIVRANSDGGVKIFFPRLGAKLPAITLRVVGNDVSLSNVEQPDPAELRRQEIAMGSGHLGTNLPPNAFARLVPEDTE